MRTVSIQFTRPANCWFKWFSWVVRLIEWTPYSHVRLKWSASWGDPVVYEASGSDVKFLGKLGLDQRPIKVLAEFNFDLTDQQYRKLLHICMANAGVNYGVKQILGIGIARLFRLSRNPFSQGRKSQVCSEVVGRFLEEVLEHDTQLDLDLAGPKDIYEYLRRL
jgi:hypothetical protein